MAKFFYLKLALTNLKKNSLTYRPYILTCMGTTAMFFVLHALSVNVALAKMPGSGDLKLLLVFGTIIIALFSVVFLLYTNSFLIKRRKREFGLFNILGMEKRHLALVMFWETFFIALLSLGLGTLSGVVFFRLMFLGLVKLTGLTIPIGFSISFASFALSFALFGSIFAITLLYNLSQISLAKPIELLKSEEVGEGEPKTKWLLSLIGLVSLGVGYYIALTTESPLQALTRFFIAVLLVIIGTYTLFTVGSIALLKFLRKRKRYYYRPRQFTVISGLLFRMKQNAVGLANICILSSAVLVTLSTTFSLYIGVEDQLRTSFPRAMEIIMYDENGQPEKVHKHVAAVLERNNLEAKNLQAYSNLTITTLQQEDSFLVGREYFSNFSPQVGFLRFLPLEDYQKFAAEPVSLGDSEVLLYSNFDYPYETLSILDHTFSVKGKAEPIAGQGYLSSFRSFYVVVKDREILASLNAAQRDIYGEGASDINYYLGFDLKLEQGRELEIFNQLNTNLPDRSIVVNSRAAARNEFYLRYGGFLFIGLFLGVLFLLGTVLIIYYKQFTEGWADRKRFKIMRQVGMSQLEVKETIRTQVLAIFFLPLVTAGVHILAAFKMISRLLAVFQLTNVSLFAWSCVCIFAAFSLFYGLVYRRTAKVYYKIVST